MVGDNYLQSQTMEVVTVLNYPSLPPQPKSPIRSERSPFHPKCKETKVIELFYHVKTGTWMGQNVTFLDEDASTDRAQDGTCRVAK